MFKKIISIILVFAMIFCGLGISAFADYTSVPVSFWDKMMLDYSNHYDDAAITSFFHDVITVPLTTDNICSQSSDNLHHAQESLSVGHDSNGTYLNCQCQYCNDTFKYYSDDLEDAYTHYSGSIGVSGITQDNKLIWYPNYDNMLLYEYTYGNTFVLLYSDNLSLAEFNVSYFGGSNVKYFVVFHNNSYSNIRSLQIYLKYNDNYPITGFYQKIKPASSCDYVDRYQAIYHESTAYNADTSTYHPKGGLVDNRPCEYSYDMRSYASGLPCQFNIYFKLPYYVITSYSGFIQPSNVTQNIQNIYQGNDTYNNIVDTTNNQFYNPTTNQYIDMSTYYYDYSTRTYNIVLADDDGTEVNVEYGTDNITVQIADTINNYYYGYSDCPEEPSHNHEWTPTTVNTRTCTQAGITTYTCESCGQAYTDVVPATGHVWDNGVLTPAVLDDVTGEIITPAFYTFTCEICGETETSEAATPPSSGITETNDLWWERLLQWLEDFKNSLFNKLDNLGSSDDDQIDINIEGDEFTFNDGEDPFSFKEDFLAKFGIFSDLWEVGQYVVNIVSQDAAYAYDFDINEALSIEGDTP